MGAKKKAQFQGQPVLQSKPESRLGNVNEAEERYPCVRKEGYSHHRELPKIPIKRGTCSVVIYFFGGGGGICLLVPFGSMAFKLFLRVASTNDTTFQSSTEAFPGFESLQL